LSRRGNLNGLKGRHNRAQGGALSFIHISC
jgi:hypothetical protein